jgi:hypothetical protein
MAGAAEGMGNHSRIVLKRFREAHTDSQQTSLGRLCVAERINTLKALLRRKRSIGCRPSFTGCFGTMKTKPKQNPWNDATAFISVKDKLPPLGQWVMAATPFACCVGFLGPWGVWREAHDNTPIEQVESWHPVGLRKGAPTQAAIFDEQPPVKVTVEAEKPRQ